MMNPTDNHRNHRGRALPPLGSIGALAVLLLWGWSLPGCDILAAGVDSYTDCDRFSADYDTSLENEGTLSDEIEVSDPFPMAIVVSQDSLNTLFAAIADGDLGELRWDYEMTISGFTIPYALIIDPDLPLIQIGGDLTCPDCLLLEMSFGIWIELYPDTSYALRYGGSGSATYQFPISMVDNGTESSSIIAHFSQSEFLNIDLSISGISDDYMDAIEPYIADAATIIVRDYYGDTEIFELEAWRLGNGDIKLLGRGPYIYPENHTIAIGIHTNLIRPLESAITLNPSLPEGADIGMQFHPELIQRIVQRMLNEGFIPRTYDATGEVNEAGGMKVGLNYMEGNPQNELLATSFRVWELGGDYCGYVDISADLGIGITDQSVALTIANLDISGGDGIGTAAIAAEDWITSQFTLDMRDYSELAINYRELALPYGKQAEMSSESFALTVDGHGLSVYLNLDAIVDTVTGERQLLD